MKEDHQLLREFRRSGSEGAFRELVDRHLKLVFSAAMRMVNGDAHLAQDISQLVFSKLASKASSLPTDVVLAGWLHRDTRFTALAVLRKERRRVEREQEAFKMHALETAGQEMDWTALRPILDEMLDELREEDRQALLLRFFEQRSLAEVGAAMGLAEDAARKRLARALDKLRGLLASRSITTTASALSALLVAHGAELVPPGLAGTLTRAALAGATAGAGGGILSLVASARMVTVLATLAVTVVIGGAVATIYKSHSNGVPVAHPASPSAGGSTPGRPSPMRVAADKPAIDTIAELSLANALRKVEAALHDPKPTESFPNLAMEVAIEQLGNRKKAANPLLQATLKDPDGMVRMRAVDGLGIIGPEAKEATSILLGLLRSCGLGGQIKWTMYSTVPRGDTTALAGVEPDNLTLFTLGRIGAAPEILPELARILRDDAPARHTILTATGTHGSDRLSMVGANWLWACADGDSAVLNDAFRPLLTDRDPDVRRAAASCLVNALGTNADAGVFPAAIELLRSGDDNTLRLVGLQMVAFAIGDPYRRPIGAESNKPGVDLARLGGGLKELVAALTEVANETRREDLRTDAWRLLDDLNSHFLADNPRIAAAMESKRQMAVFEAKVESRQASKTEMLEGLKRFPAAAAVVAEVLVDRGAEGRDALPALGEAMVAMTPPPDASGPDRGAAVRARERLADAMEKIAPDLPKPLFTRRDVDSIMRLMVAPSIRADAERRGRISAARKLAGWPTVGPSDATSEQIRSLLAALKEADGAMYDAVTARVAEIDPLFH